MDKYELSPWQIEYMKHFDDDLYIACTGIGAGKTRVLAIWLIMQCIQKPGIRGIVIAQTYQALMNVLFREMEIVCAQLNIVYKFNRSDKRFMFPNGSVLMGYSSENPTGILGLSEIALLAIDEAAYCSEEIYNYAKDRMRGSKYESKVRLISSPNSLGVVSNWFSTLCKKNPEKIIKASSLDNWFSRKSYKQELKERYVEGSNLYRQQVLGEILDMDAASQIVFRDDFIVQKRMNAGNHYLGYDASGIGADNDVFITIDDYGVIDLFKACDLKDTFQRTNIIDEKYRKFGIKAGYADGTGGYSNGIIDVCKKMNIAIEGLNFASKAEDDKMYPNVRTEMYMELANEIKHGFWVPEEIQIEILAQQMTVNGKGQVQLVPKDLVKKTLGHSPDMSDALALAVYAKNHYGEISKESEIAKAKDVADRYMRYFQMFN